MLNKRSIIATVVVVIFIFVYEFLVHGMALSGVYEGLASVWRSNAEMEAKMPWMMVGQVLFGIMFVVLFHCSKCRGSVSQGACFGLIVGLFLSSGMFGWYAVLPITLNLMVLWIITGVIECVLMGVILSLMLKE